MTVRPIDEIEQGVRASQHAASIFPSAARDGRNASLVRLLQWPVRPS